MMNRILKSYVLSLCTSLYFIPDIYFLSNTWSQCLLAYFIQSIHDWICIYFLWIYLFAYVDRSLYVRIHLLYLIILFSFCMFKQCILTILYNRLLELPSCSHYIPLWKRLFLIHPKHQPCVQHMTIHVWLDGHLFQSFMMILLNVWWMKCRETNQKPRFKEKKRFEWFHRSKKEKTRLWYTRQGIDHEHTRLPMK